MKSRYIIFSILLSVGSYYAMAQENMLLDRSFWKSQPDIREIENKINEGHSPTAMTEFSFDATVYAILENNPTETIKYLLTQGNDIDKITHDGRTYLMWASYKGNLELMKYLVTAGARQDVIDQHGYSLLMFPASTGQSNIAMYDYMINELGIDIQNERDRSGRNALLAYAASLQDFEVVDYMISKGLDINSTDDDGNGIFHYAALTGEASIMETLADTYGVNTAANTATNENAIIFASRKSTRSGVTTPLSFYQFLAGEYDLDPAITPDNGVTALHNIASRSKDIETFRWFIEQGVDPNAVDNQGNNVLVNAAGRATPEIMDYLTGLTTDINHQNKEGISALTQAVRNNTTDVIRQLLANGADVKVTDRNGNSLGFHLVDTYRDEDDFKSRADILIASGLDMTVMEAGKTTLLHHAVKKQDTALLKLLLSYGIDINTVDENNETALHKAAMQAKDEHILRFLVEAGAKTDIATAFDEYPYDLAKSNELLTDKDITFLKNSTP